MPLLNPILAIIVRNTYACSFKNTLVLASLKTIPVPNADESHARELAIMEPVPVTEPPTLETT